MVDDLLFRMKKHPTLDIICFSDGCILKPKLPHSSHGGFTYGTVNKKGYLVTQIQDKQYRVHRLIAETFLPNPEGKPTVDHIDRGRMNNSLSNLRWATLSEQKNNSSLVINRLQLGVRQSEDSDEYTKQEVTEGIQNIVVKYIEENEGLFAPDFKIELWDVQNYSWNGSPNLCQVVWTISINEGEICVMTPINAS